MKFNKYHGLGNDFIIVEEQPLDYSELAKKICDRHIGVGADGLIIVKKNPLTMLFYNADGSEGTMCGNGLRCFGKYCQDHKVGSGPLLEVQTLAGPKTVEFLKDNLFKTNLGKPIFDPEIMQIHTTEREFLNQPLFGVRVSAVFTGAIHAVVFVLNADSVQVQELGQRISNHPIFGDRANVDFVQVIDRGNFSVRTYERGVGWTMACGTCAAASFIIGKSKGYCDDEVTVSFPLGKVFIQGNEDGEIFLTGPAEKICSGDF